MENFNVQKICHISNSDKSDGSKQVLTKSQKRQYAIAMDKEREQKKRADGSYERKGSGLESARAVAARLKAKKEEKI